jgi:hypothetical protein
LFYVFERLGWSREQAGSAFVVLLPLMGLAVVSWGYHDYRRRAALEVVIDLDRVEVGIASRHQVLRHDDVVSIRLVPTRMDFACVLIPRSGRALGLPPEIAPFMLAREPLESTLIRELVRRLDERISGGESVALHISTRQLIVMINRALAALLVSAAFLANPWRIPMGIIIFRHAILIMWKSWRATRGGVVIERDGLRRFSRSTSAFTPWTALEQTEAGPFGLELRSSDGEEFVLSSLADDFWPALRWLNSRIK